MEGLNRGIFEIFEIVLVISLSLIIISALIYTSKPNFINAKLMASEISYISSIATKDSEITLDYKQIKDDFNLNSNNQEIEIVFDDKSKAKKEYLGEKVDLTKSSNSIFITRS